MTAALSVAQRAGIRVGGVRVDGQHVGLDGGLRGARRTAQPGADSRGKDCVGQAVAGDGLRRADLPGEGGLRWLPARAHRDREAGADLPAEFRESVPAGRAKDAGVRDCGGVRLECARPPDCSGREPGQQFGAGQGIPRAARAGAGGAAAADLRDSGGGGESAGAKPEGQPWRDAGAGGGAYARDGDSDWESGFVAQGGAGDSGDRRMVPGRDRGGDRDCQGGDRRGGTGLRAGFGGDAWRD